MILAIRQLTYHIRKLKQIPPQQWVIPPSDATKKYQQADLSHLNIRYYRQIKKDYKRGLQQQPKPISPNKGPITVSNPKIHNKMYRWCSCGMSLSQPFCDNSHKGTSFKPYKFTIQQPVNQITLCGCKNTTIKPFCDGKSCK